MAGIGGIVIIIIIANKVHLQIYQEFCEIL